jgi:hypothetical protein
MARHFPGAAGRPVVLHADMPAYWHAGEGRSHRRTEAEIVEEMEACCDAARSNGAAYLVRPHPSQDRRFYEDRLKGRADAFLAADADLHDLLRNVDLVIVRTTTVGLEAAYLRKRILQLDAGFHRDVPLARMGVAWGVESFGELEAGVRRALGSAEEFQEKLERIERLLPGEAAAPKIAGILLDRLGAGAEKA